MVVAKPQATDGRVAKKGFGGWYIGGMEGFAGKCSTGTGGGDDFGLPELSALQYLVVGVLFDGEI